MTVLIKNKQPLQGGGEMYSGGGAGGSTAAGGASGMDKYSIPAELMG